MPLVLLLAGCAPHASARIERRIQRIERGLLLNQGDPPWKRVSLAERMAHYNVPGVSIAVVNNNEIEWARGYGTLEAGGEEPVTPDTLFQAGSIGKSLVATGAMHLVEEGVLDLDQDVSERLISWQVPENEFTAAERVTLRRLLSHTAGTTEYGYQGYAQGQRLPSVVQILDGIYPANSPAIRVEAEPGTRWAYSNGGFMIAELVMTEATAEPFAAFMQRTVLEPAGMTQSTFEVPLPDHLAANVARGHRPDGQTVYGGWHVYPEMGTGASLWSTPSDLARFGIEMMHTYRGESERLLPQATVREMLTRQTPGGVAAYGLGFGVSEEGTPRFHFSHDGGTEGYRTFMVMYPELGRGAVIMTNGHIGDGLWHEILNSISVEYDLVRDLTLVYSLVLLGIVGAGVAALLWWRQRRRMQA